MDKAICLCDHHAYSLKEMVRWFKKMIKTGNFPDGVERTDQLTTEYCDELIGALSG